MSKKQEESGQEEAEQGESQQVEPQEQSEPAAQRLQCGVVMPISALDGCSEQHWLDVKQILFSAIEDAGFVPALVSDSDDVGIIQKRIIQNLYDNPIVVCDVSGKNPNVMFELGMRLAFDKPTIIVKDDQTSYSFDTSPIEHLEYRRDLRFQRIVDFQTALGVKIKGTVERANLDSEYSPFLKDFGKFTVAKIETTVVSQDAYVMERLDEISKVVLNPATWDRHAVRRPEKFEDILPTFYEIVSTLVAAYGATHSNSNDLLFPQGRAPLVPIILDEFVKRGIVFADKQYAENMTHSYLQHYVERNVKPVPGLWKTRQERLADINKA